MADLEESIIPLIQKARQRLSRTTLDFKRYLYHKINWDARLVGVKGARGTGKTTILLQRILETDADLAYSVYVSLDDMWFALHSLEELVAYLYPRGVTVYYLDEVHKYPEWSRVIKNLYDSYPDIIIRYTGSALLAIDHSRADLSRRQSLYTLRGMSFREFLEYEGLYQMEPLQLQELLQNHVHIASALTSKIKVLKYFEEYLEHGYYPFYKENPLEFLEHLAEVIQLVIEVDIPESVDLAASTINKLKRLMMLVAENAPLEPNISKLSERLECSREQCVKMLYLMDKAKLVQILFREIHSYKQMRGPEKVLAGDTNLMYALTGDVNTGTARETFFVNQLSLIGEILLASKGEYVVDGRYLFEVGGAGKKFSQIADIPNSYLVIDNVEVGYGAKIPLYLFGMLY